MEDNIWKYGEYDLDKSTLFKYLQSNLDSFMTYHSFDSSQRQQFGNTLNIIKKAIMDDQLSSEGGYGNFKDYSNTLADDEITKNALHYVHKIATGYGSRIKPTKKTKVEEPEEEELEDFNYDKHGLYYDFNKQYNPFGYDKEYGTWKSSFTTQEALNNAFLKDLGKHKQRIINTKYNYTNSPVSKEQYLAMLDDLDRDIRADGIQDSDKNKMRALGFNPASFILQVQTPPVEETPVVETPVVETPEPEPVKKESKYGNMPFREYLEKFDELGLETSDAYRLTGLALDVISIFNPEPFSAAGMGYASDYLNLQADEMDGINDSWWDDALNFGLSTLGAVPLIGDLGMTGKVAKNIIKGATSITKLIAAPSIAIAITNAGQNYEEIAQSAENVKSGDFTVNDLRNLYTLLQIALGTKNAVKSGKAAKKAKQLDEQAQDALVVQVKNKGKTQDIAITGQGKTDLEGLRRDPEGFKNYLRQNYTDLDQIELANVKTQRKKILGMPLGKKEGSTVQFENKKVQEQGEVPSRFSRARHYMQNTEEANFATRKTPENTPKTGETPKTEETKKKKKKYDKARQAESENRKRKKKKSTESKTETPASEMKPNIVSEPQRIKQESRLAKWKQKFEKFMDDLLEDEAGSFKKGGIIIAKGGTKVYGNGFDEILDDTFYQTLYGENKKAIGSFGGDSYRTNSGLNYKKSATAEELSDLESYSAKYLPYTNDALGQQNRRQDIYTVFSEALSNGETLEDALGKYNNTISKMYNYKRNQGHLIGEYNDDDATEEFNESHKHLYRSANGEKGIYGYDSNLDHVNGSTTLQRGPDRTSEEVLIDFNGFNFGQNDAFKAALGNRQLYKTKSGHYYLYTPQEQVVQQQVTPGQEESKGDPVVKEQDGKIIVSEDIKKDKGVEETPPVKPEQPFFTLDKGLEALNYGRTVAHNKKILQLGNELGTLLYTPLSLDTKTDNSLDIKNEGDQAMGEGIRMAKQLFTSDADYNAAVVREFYNDSLKRKDQKYREANEIDQKNAERITQNRNQNRESAYNIAMKNLENIHHSRAQKVQNKIDESRATLDSGTNYINKLITWLTASNKEEFQKKSIGYAKALSSYIYRNPDIYFQGDKELQRIWDKSNSGETLTPAEQMVMRQIRERLQDAYNAGIYGYEDTNYNIKKPEWEGKFKKGGVITKDMAKTVLEFLKESNKNYNKAMDRSSKGFYNYVKLQRKK